MCGVPGAEAHHRGRRGGVYGADPACGAGGRGRHRVRRRCDPDHCAGSGVHRSRGGQVPSRVGEEGPSDAGGATGANGPCGVYRARGRTWLSCVVRLLQGPRHVLRPACVLAHVVQGRASACLLERRAQQLPEQLPTVGAHVGSVEGRPEPVREGVASESEVSVHRRPAAEILGHDAV